MNILENKIFSTLLFRNLKRAVYILLLFTFLPVVAHTPAEYKVKAVFIFNFTRFVDWPESAFSSPAAPFVIGIAGKNPFQNYLQETIAGEKVGSHEIVIRNVETDKEITECHLLFINYTDALKVNEVISTINNRSILTVGEMPVFEKQGGMIRFYTEENKIRLVINSEAARLANLNISSKLLSVAKIKSGK